MKAARPAPELDMADKADETSDGSRTGRDPRAAASHSSKHIVASPLSCQLYTRTRIAPLLTSQLPYPVRAALFQLAHHTSPFLLLPTTG